MARGNKFLPVFLIGVVWLTVARYCLDFVSPTVCRTKHQVGRAEKVARKFFFNFGGGKIKEDKAHDVVITTFDRAIYEEEVRAAQKLWSDSIKKISKTYLEDGDYVSVAAEAAGELYGYGHTNVLFKPTKAAQRQFRPMASDAMSYFVGSQAVEDGGISEDSGFAINGGRGWADVVFDNHQIEITGNVAFAMGNYVFTAADDGSKTKVEYTFGYKKNADGKVRIFLHHSSVPFRPPTISQDEVLAAQKLWSDSIKKISKVYLEGGDYVSIAAEAAGKLYGYGHTNVMFKPTKAAQVQFRPMAHDAMSYFVGNKAIEGGYSEDAGFAINGGKGWSEVVFDNHQIFIGGDVAVAMGNYYFTPSDDATSKTKVEYTFGYKKNPDGKVRIFLHHSSVPFQAPVTVTPDEPEEVADEDEEESEEVTDDESVPATIDA